MDPNSATSPAPPSPSALAFSLSKRLPNLFPPSAAAAALRDPSDMAPPQPPPQPQQPAMQKIAPTVAQPSLSSIRDARRRAREALRASADELPTAAMRAAEEITIGHSTNVMPHPNLVDGPNHPLQQVAPRHPQQQTQRQAPQLMLANSGKTTWLEDVSKTWQVGLVRDSGMLQSTKAGQEFNEYLHGLEQEVARESDNNKDDNEEEYGEGDDEEDEEDDDEEEDPAPSPSITTSVSPAQGSTVPEKDMDTNMISSDGGPSTSHTPTLVAPVSQGLPPPHPLSQTAPVAPGYPPTTASTPAMGPQTITDMSGGDASDDNESNTRSVRKVMESFALTDKSVGGTSSSTSVPPGVTPVPKHQQMLSPQQPSIIRSAPPGMSGPVTPQLSPQAQPPPMHLAQQPPQPRLLRAGSAPLAAAVAAAGLGSPGSTTNSSQQSGSTERRGRGLDSGPPLRRQAARIAPAPAPMAAGATSPNAVPNGGAVGAGVRIAPALNGSAVFPPGGHMYAATGPIGAAAAAHSQSWLDHGVGRPGIAGQKKRGRKRKNPELSEEERALVRKEQNRESARLSRVRRKVIAAEYEGRLSALLGENAMLRKQVEGLNDRLVYLQSLLTITVRPESGQGAGVPPPPPGAGQPQVMMSGPMHHHPQSQAPAPVSISPAPTHR